MWSNLPGREEKRIRNVLATAVLNRVAQRGSKDKHKSQAREAAGIDFESLPASAPRAIEF